MNLGKTSSMICERAVGLSPSTNTESDQTQIMSEIQTAVRKYTEMGDVEQKVRLGIGSAAAAAAIFAPLSYKWKGVLTAVATGAILTGIFRISPVRRAFSA
jgi:hypothetical protein